MTRVLLKPSGPLLLAALLGLALAGCSGDEPVKSAAPATPLYVAIGASETVGTGARNPESDGWAPQLLAKMPAGTRFANLGIGGLQTHEAVAQALPVALDLQPNIVTVWLAVNDYSSGVALADYRADLDTILGGLAHGTRARVFVANMPDLTLIPAFHDRDQTTLHRETQEWNAQIAASAAANGATLVDLYSGWTELRDNRGYISRDGLHPSGQGYRRIAEIFWQTMGGA